jgi:hypothetical protein
MDWQTVASAVLGSSIASAALTALLQQRNWIKQKRNEERLTIAKRVLELSNDVDKLVRWGKKDIADIDEEWFERTMIELSLLQMLTTVVFESAKAKKLAFDFFEVLSKPSGELWTRRFRSAAAWNNFVCCLYAEALNISEERLSPFGPDELLDIAARMRDSETSPPPPAEDQAGKPGSISN